ncbi:hypothetical protein ACQKMI_25060, partial [Lysinibacillus sp. NPDC097214]|uniref:hypothetical protein n=1 Tax=Lysinibacillus sp. NPDC097214 TaxID=3390584 RepID=UPI003CFF0431
MFKIISKKTHNHLKLNLGPFHPLSINLPWHNSVTSAGGFRPTRCWSLSRVLLLSLRFRTDKTVLLSLRFRTDKT